MGESIAPSIICPTLVGRAGALAALRLLLERAKQGAGQVALISGEAGIGKSRLAAEAKSYAHDDRCTVRWRYDWTNVDGESGHVRGVDVFRVRDGKVAEKLAYVKG